VLSRSCDFEGSLDQRGSFGVRPKTRLPGLPIAVYVTKRRSPRPVAATKRGEHSRPRSLRLLVIVELRDGRQHVLGEATDGIVANRFVDRAQAHAKAMQECPDDGLIVGIARKPGDAFTGDCLGNCPTGRVKINAQTAGRHFDIRANVTVTLSNLELYKGRAANGGSILNGGTLTLVNCNVYDNAATDNGGAVFNDTGGELTIGAGPVFNDKVA
jgi:hypothetical protein